MSTPPEDDRIVPAALAWVAGVAASFLLAWWGLAAYLDHDAVLREARNAAGWHWPFDDRAELVGGRARGLDAALDGGSLEGTVGPAGGGFVSLAFEGDRIDARLHHLLQLDISVDRSTTMLLFHRSRLDGPVIGTTPIELVAGRQALRIDLARLSWSAQSYVDGEPRGAPVETSWGGSSGVVASLRLHPALTPGTRFAVSDLAIVGSGAALERGPWPETAHTATRGGGTDTVTVSPLGGIPERILAARDAALAERPAQRWRVAGPWPSPRPLLLAALAIALLLVARLPLEPPGRALLLVASFTAGALAVLTVPPDRPFATVVAATSLLVALGQALFALARPAGAAWVGTMGSWRIAIVLPIAALPLCLATGTMPDGSAVLSRLGAYLPWALAQQAVLQLVLVRGLGGHDRWGAIAGAAVLFGWLHFPNFALMILTGILGLVAAVHFRRHRALLPLAVGHAVAGAVLLSTLPEAWLRSGVVGMRYFGGG